MGEQFGHYEILRRIAAGGMAEVFLAKQTGIGGFERLVCIKRILAHLGAQEDFIKMFQDEARIAANLLHPNVAQIYDIGQIDGAYYIAMEYVRGEDLRRVYNQEVARGRAMPAEPAAQILMGAATGLDYAHRQTSIDGKPLGIVHRDVSPQNILCTYDGYVKLVDFGVAKAAGKMNETRTGVLKGKYSYMSPEQAAGDPIDARTDIFALGITLYEVTTGVRLFKRENEIETLHAVIECKVTPPSEVLPGYDAELEALVMRALDKDADARFQTAGEMARELEQMLVRRGHPTSASSLGAYMQDLFAEKLADELLFGTQPWDERLTPSSRPPEVRLPSKEEASAEAFATVEPTQDGAPPPENTINESKPVNDELTEKSGPSPKAVWRDGWGATSLQSGSDTNSQTATQVLVAEAPRVPTPTALRQTSRRPAPVSAARKRSMVTMVAAVAVACFIVVLASFWQSGSLGPLRSGELLVESEPRGARVVFVGPGADEINARYDAKGRRTPFVVTEGIPLEGRWVARFTKDNYVPIERHLPSLSEGQAPEALFAELQPRKDAREPKDGTELGTLSLITTPPGAQVTINGNELDSRTPLTDLRVRGGETHRLELRLNGYETRHDSVFVEAGGRRTLELTLLAERKGLRGDEVVAAIADARPATAGGLRSFLSVSSPVKMRVSLGNRYLGETPLRRVAVEPGTQKLRIEGDDGFVMRKKVRLVPGRVEAIDVRAGKGNLAVNASPWAWVRVGKNEPVETPKQLALYEGEYDVVFECPDGKKKTLHTSVRHSQTAALSVNCRE